jgi:hypothetical protein
MLVASLCVGLTSLTAWAGTKTSWPVTIDKAGQWAQGALGSARNSSDGVQQIYCNTRTGGYSYCFVQDATGAYATCVSTSPEVSRLVASINGDSAIFFSWDSSGNCTTFVVYSGSAFEPKQ